MFEVEGHTGVSRQRPGDLKQSFKTFHFDSIKVDNMTNKTCMYSL